MAVYKTRKGTVRTGADRKGGGGGSSKNVQDLASQLEGVATQAKSLGMNTAKSDAMVAQTRAEGSKAFKGSSFDKGQVDTAPVITSADTKKQPVMTIPPPPTPKAMTSVMDANTAALAGASGATFDAKTGQITPAPTTTPTPADNFSAIANQYLAANKQAFDAMPTAEDRMKAQQRMLRPKENVVNSLQGQLSTITSNRDAEMMKLEGQGRGQTSGFIGGEQARISREAFIQAAPIQAQLAIAQDDLESARSYASQLFQAQSQDAQARYNYQKEVNGMIFTFLNEDEKRKMAAKEREEDRAFSVEQNNRNTLKQLSMQAIEYGQGALAGEIMRLDPTSATFDADYADVTSRLRKPVAASGGGSDWDLKEVNGQSMWVNKRTQEVRPIDGGASGVSLKPIKDKEITDLSETWTAKNSVVSLVDKLQSNIKENGTQVLWGQAAGERSGATTNLLLAMKNLEKTGALDKGTIDVLTGTIPSSKFFATEKAQIAALEEIKSTIQSKVDEYVGSYRGTTAETDPRTQRIYSTTTFDPSIFDQTDIADLNALFGGQQTTTSAFNPASFY